MAFFITGGEFTSAVPAGFSLVGGSTFSAPTVTLDASGEFLIADLTQTLAGNRGNWRITGLTATQAHARVYMVDADFTKYVEAFYTSSGNELAFRETGGGTTTTITAPAAPFYLQMRHDGTNWHWETGSDGVTYTDHKSQAAINPVGVPESQAFQQAAAGGSVLITAANYDPTPAPSAADAFMWNGSAWVEETADTVWSGTAWV
jgi:hypothetical protein